MLISRVKTDLELDEKIDTLYLLSFLNLPLFLTLR